MRKKLLLFVILNFFQSLCIAQLAPKCSPQKFSEQYTNNIQWNNLLDKACGEINSYKYIEALNTLDEAMKLDSVLSKGGYIPNVYIKKFHDKIRWYLIEQLGVVIGQVNEKENSRLKSKQELGRSEAEYLFSFLNYIEYPNQNNLNVYTIGILGVNKFLEDALIELIKSKKVNGKMVQLKKISAMSDFEKLNDPIQILFVSNSEDFDLRYISNYSSLISTLLVTDNSYKTQTMINFNNNKELLKYELNLDNFEFKKLKFEGLIAKIELINNVHFKGEEIYLTQTDINDIKSSNNFTKTLDDILKKNHETKLRLAAEKEAAEKEAELLSKKKREDNERESALKRSLIVKNNLAMQPVLERNKDKYFKNSLNYISRSFFNLNQIIVEVVTPEENNLKQTSEKNLRYLEGVEIEVRRDKKTGYLYEKGVTNKDGLYLFKNLSYDNFYHVFFSKPGYYTKEIRIETYDAVDYDSNDTLFNFYKNVKFNNIKNITVYLTKIIFDDIKSPCLDSYYSNVYYFEPIKLSDFGYTWDWYDDYVYTITTGKKDSLFISSGGICLWNNTYINNLEKDIEKSYEMEVKINAQRQIKEKETKFQIQLLEKEKMERENLLLSQNNKLMAQANRLNETELTKEKAILDSKQNQLELAHQEQKMKTLLEEKKEAKHKAELKQRSIIIYSVIAGLFLVLVFASFVFRSFRNANKQNKIIVAQKSVVEKQKHLVEEKNREITDSIEYALRIQTAILPPQKIVKQFLENSFILYKPKDIVAGDFYWMETIQLTDDSISNIANETTNQLILFAACDCTGHGVPGAMVSVVCHNALNRAVREFGLTEPAAILDKTAEIVIENFSKSEEDIKDGMDISLCSLTPALSKGKGDRIYTLQWAGANNPLWLLQNGELIETKADKQPIGMNDNKKPFSNHTFTLNHGDIIYLFTDGFADQFGGEKGEKKLTKKRFKELLLSFQNKTMQEQGIALDKFITDYRKEVEQIDDILVMGVKV